MKKYIIFGYDYCYPIGGMNDIKEEADSIEEGIKLGKRIKYQNIQIVDRDTWEIVWEK